MVVLKVSYDWGDLSMTRKSQKAAASNRARLRDDRAYDRDALFRNLWAVIGHTAGIIRRHPADLADVLYFRASCRRTWDVEVKNFSIGLDRISLGLPGRQSASEELDVAKTQCQSSL